MRPCRLVCDLHQAFGHRASINQMLLAQTHLQGA
jgi:hypothetical protein